MPESLIASGEHSKSAGSQSIVKMTLTSALMSVGSYEDAGGWRRGQDSNLRWVLPTHAFQACPLSRSGTSPGCHFLVDGFNRLRRLVCSRVNGGEGGIRTRDPGYPEIPVFETGAFNHSATSPRAPVEAHRNCKKPPGNDLFSHTSQCSIVSATTFHFRVRDGNGWFHRALITKGLLRYVCFPAFATCW